MTAARQDRDFIGYGRHAPRIDWPGDARVVLNLVIVYEEGSEYSLTEGHGRNEGWGEYQTNVDPSIRDLGTETHFEYGSRVGIWRLARMVDELGVKATISACALALDRNREVAAWMNEGGHDILGHGYRWFEAYRQSREEERDHLRRAVALYKDVLGTRPIGWNQRSFPSINTFDLLVEEGGFLYTSDPCNDEIPYFVPSTNGRMLVVPYSKTFNDSRFLVAPGYGNPADFARDVCAGIDYLAAEAASTGGRMMTVAVHARWTGQPNRASALRHILEHALSKPGVEIMRRDDIAKYFLENYGHLPTLSA
ncbi:MAG: polysaccharide deacetylase family protein [Paracoccaceae bacterium]